MADGHYFSRAPAPFSPERSSVHPRTFGTPPSLLGFVIIIFRHWCLSLLRTKTLENGGNVFLGQKVPKIGPPRPLSREQNLLKTRPFIAYFRLLLKSPMWLRVRCNSSFGLLFIRHWQPRTVCWKRCWEWQVLAWYYLYKLSAIYGSRSSNLQRKYRYSLRAFRSILWVKLTT